MTSTAATHPATPDTAPNTGNFRRQSGGGSGTRHARHAVRPGSTVVTWTDSSYIAASTSGFRCRTASAFSAYRSSNSGAASTTTSASPTSRATFAGVTFSGTATTSS